MPVTLAVFKIASKMLHDPLIRSYTKIKDQNNLRSPQY